MRSFLVWCLVAVLAASAIAADRGAVRDRVRAELATLLKKDPAKLPVDKPVTELGADELTVVEWVMACERAYRIRISDDKTVDPKTKATRKDLTIASMAAVVAEALEKPNAKRK